MKKAEAAVEDSSIDFSGTMSTLWRGKWIILGCIVACMLLGAYQAYFRATPLYESSSVVMLESRQEQVVDLESVIGGLSADASVINTEVQVLKSRSLLGKVVDKLKLTEDPEFNTTLVPSGFLGSVIGGIKKLIPGESDPANGMNDKTHAEVIRDATVSELLNHLTVRNLAQSLVFEIKIETTSAQKSKLIADTMADLYIQNQLEVKFDATEQATSWLTDRVSQLQTELEAAESKVNDFKGKTDVISPDALAAMDRQLKDTRERITNTQDSLAANQKTMAAVQSAQSPADKAAALGDDQLQRMAQNLDQDGVQAAFDTRFQQVFTRLQVSVLRDQSQIKTLQASEADLQKQINSQSADLITLQQLTREADASRMLYEYFLSRLKETSAQQGIQQADSRVLSHAVMPRMPSSPNKKMVLVLSALLGFFAGVAFVLLREARNNTFRNATDLERYTGYAVLGQVPIIPARRRKDSIHYLAEKPTSQAAEAIRNLRTSLLLSNVDQPPQVIMTSSSFPGEGKTTVSLALAQNFSGIDKKVLFIEGDVRRRMLSQYVEMKDHPGLISVLTGKMPLREAVFRDETINADILIGEESSSNAADVFSSARFTALIEEARKLYDFIVIDTPPVMVVPDARVIAQNVDAVIFVVKWDSTHRPQVVDAINQFETVNRPVAGVVLNQINTRKMMSYGYGGYGAYGGYGYHKQASKYYNN
ncbi:polysaccharide biosynthesis tyrosine autokinase [Pseudooceanicola sp. CBS1P-1]|uniref:non-specific protein-tyrosine kinase n=1 Tax=Pseudooceanicola albus TaxID=2692189 RepID=A0A6L7GAS6_9RHOB|nr:MULTISPECIES: polysaccharide biosynthesis tyrosine autokinase [Pseudooceanicola]MBT9386735.1 polysaccharide biosynthesis tyrosine autokinase [Pseudooceanicola endophyticus]MXN20782.1 polysaccharide biosynthesis tyrosine autokinase [Pseudooceanicola albus]